MVTAGFEMAAADIAECRDKHQDGKAMRESDGRITVDAERYCRPGANEDQREGADELRHELGCK
jgi:hypothetical protein